MRDFLRRVFGGQTKNTEKERDSLPVVDAREIDRTARIRVDLSPQLLSLSVPDVPTQISSRLAPWGDFVSGAVLAMKAKRFDDGLYATVELMAHRGKRDLVQKLLTSLDVEGETTALLGAAQMVTGKDVDEPLRSRAEPIARAFLADEQSGKPIGFYTWSEELRGIFQQDRLLQANVVEHRDLARVAHVIHAQPELRATYESALQLAERLTNPLSDFDLRPWLRALDEGAFYEPPTFPAKLALLPPSVAHETELGKKLYGDKPIPPGFDLMNELIACIRAGTVSLKPTDSSGWYDRQTWSLETLVAPDRGAESARLHLDDSYARHLVKMFKGALTLTRETHIKQLQIEKLGAAGGREQAVVKIVVRPKLRVEPLVTHYTRRAEAYRFVRSVLDEAFGAHVLAAKSRIREDGMAALPLGEELAWMERLFGEAAMAAMAAEQDLGMRNDGDVSTFTTWASTLKDDIDVAQDARAMVPVFFDILRGKIKAWLFMGWNIEWMTASFRRPPDVTLLDPSNAKIVFEPAMFPMATPVMEEAYVSRILDRREFRQLCDLHGTPEKIIAALQ